MRHGDLMQNPFYIPILLAIEATLHKGDQQAASQGVPLTDSNVRSLLVRASHAAQGKRPRPVPDFAAAKDRLLAELLNRLIAVRESLLVEEKSSDGTVEQQNLSAAEWVATLGAVKESCALRTGNEPGSRNYLDFLTGFLAQATGGK